MAPIIVNAPGGAINADDARALRAGAITAGPAPDLLGALQRAVPGIVLADPQGNAFETGLIWRGYGLSALQGSEQGLAVYLDGVRFNQPFGDTLLLDLLPEAALAGAQLREASPVYGRNAQGGVLLLTSATARDLPGLRLTTGVDSIGGTRQAGSAGFVRGDNAVLIMADWVRDPGWRRSGPSRLGRMALSLDHKGTNWGVALRASGALTRLTGNAVAPEQLLAADYRAVFTFPDTTRAQALRGAVLPWLALSSTLRIEGTIAGSWLSRRSANGDLADFAGCAGTLGQLCLTSDDGTEEALLDPAGRPVAADPAIARYGVTNRGTESTRDVQLGLQLLDETETGAGTRRIALGLALERASTHFAASSELSAVAPDRRITGLGTTVTSSGGAITSADFDARLHDLALYASAQIPLRPGLDLEAALRWSRTGIDLADHLGSALNGRSAFARANPSVELDWEPSTGLAIHAGYAETSRAPTPAELSCADPALPCALGSFFVSDPPLRQVVARHWSAGMRAQRGPFAARLDLWRADGSDEIRAFATAVRGRAYFANGGRSRRQGVDASLDWHAGRWRAALGYAYTDARFRDGFTALSPDNPAANTDGTTYVAPGSRIPGLPRHSADLALDYDATRWSLGLTVHAQGSQTRIGDDANLALSLPGFATIALRGRAELGFGLTLSAELRNLLDRRYGTFGTFTPTADLPLPEAPGADDPRAMSPGAPRRITVAITARF